MTNPTDIQQRETIALKPCPFCGGEPGVSEFAINEECDTNWAVACDGSLAPEGWVYVEHYANFLAPTKAEAITAWNLRSNPQPGSEGARPTADEQAAAIHEAARLMLTATTVDGDLVIPNLTMQQAIYLAACSGAGRRPAASPTPPTAQPVEITDEFVTEANAKATRSEALTHSELAAAYAYEIGWRDGHKEARVVCRELSGLSAKLSTRPQPGEVERLNARIAHLEKSETVWRQWRDEVQEGWVRSEKEFGEIEGEVERLRSALSEIEASASRGNGPIARDHADDALRTIGLRARAALTPSESGEAG